VLHGGLVAPPRRLSGLAVLAAVVLIAWVADAGPGPAAPTAVRAAADAWLLAQRRRASIPAGHVRGIPLGLTLLAAVVLHRAGASLARAVEVTDLRAAARATAALAVPYGLLARRSPSSPPPGPRPRPLRRPEPAPCCWPASPVAGGCCAPPTWSRPWAGGFRTGLPAVARAALGPASVGCWPPAGGCCWSAGLHGGVRRLVGSLRPGWSAAWC